MASRGKELLTADQRGVPPAKRGFTTLRIFQY